MCCNPCGTCQARARPGFCRSLRLRRTDIGDRRATHTSAGPAGSHPITEVKHEPGARSPFGEATYFLYRLIPPHPTFATDMTEAKEAITAQHVGYWQDLTEAGIAIVFGPVADPAGVWGLAVVEAEAEDDVRALGVEEDPAVKVRDGDVQRVRNAGRDRPLV
jgi:uncharacterized protein YciI